MELRLAELNKEFNIIFDSILNYIKRKGDPYVFNGFDYIEDEGEPYDFELEKEPNKRRTASISKYGSKDGIIYFSRLSSQMIWYIAWLAYLIKSNHEEMFNPNVFIHSLIRVDKGDVADLSFKELYAWDNSDLNSIFLYAMSFIFCHEIGHNVNNHPIPECGIKNEECKYPELYRGNELEADSFAVDCVKHISNNNEHEYELAVYGIIVAQIALLFIRNKEESYVIHPDPDTRLNNSLNGIDITSTMERLIDYAKDMSEQYLKRRFV